MQRVRIRRYGVINSLSYRRGWAYLPRLIIFSRGMGYYRVRIKHLIRKSLIAAAQGKPHTARMHSELALCCIKRGYPSFDDYEARRRKAHPNDPTYYRYIYHWSPYYYAVARDGAQWE